MKQYLGLSDEQYTFKMAPSNLEIFIEDVSSFYNMDPVYASFFGKNDWGIINGFYIEYSGLNNFTSGTPIVDSSVTLSESQFSQIFYETTPYTYDFDVFKVFSTNRITGTTGDYLGETGFSAGIELETDPFHSAIVPLIGFNTSLQQIYYWYPKRYFVYSTKPYFDIYVPRLGSSKYWGIYLGCERNDFFQSNIEVSPFIFIRSVSISIYDDRDNYIGKISYDERNTNSFWFTDNSIVRIGLLKQEYDSDTNSYSYTLIYYDRDELIITDLTTIRVLTDTVYSMGKQKFTREPEGIPTP